MSVDQITVNEVYVYTRTGEYVRALATGERDGYPVVTVTGEGGRVAEVVPFVLRAA